MPLATTVCDDKTGLNPHASCPFRSPSHFRISAFPIPRPIVRFGRAARRCAVLTTLALLQQPALAVGTLAGTDIGNTATTDYVIAGNSGTASSTVTFRVDEKLDVNVSWQDAANIDVSTPDTDRVTTWLLTNTGNGNDSYSLTVNNGLGGDQFDPVFVDIYLDTNNSGTFESALDTLYAPGVNDPMLAPDASQVVFVRNSMPAGLNSGDLGITELVATSITGSGLPGMSIANAGDNNTTAVVGTSGGRGVDTGIHEVNATTVALMKSVVVTDPSGGNAPVTGATLSYRLDASVSGPGTATGIVVTDALPANTSYTSGTLTLNTTSLTDIADGDAGDVNASTANTVTVQLGDLTAASPTQTISFEVIIN
ncbi:MAG: hypothetical protein WBO34_11640 [Gammaproteobacteria bacterium]